MGHIRLGTIPKTKPWKSLFTELEQPSIDAAGVAGAVAAGAEKQLDTLKGDPALSYCFWALARVLSASREADFSAALNDIGISIVGVRSGAAFIHRISQVVERELRKRTGPTVFARIAELALRETLTREVASRSQSLFGDSIETVQNACREASTTDAFGVVAREFFANYLGRTVKLVTDKELSNRVGPAKQLASPEEATNFQTSLDQYCRESAQIVQEYAGQWLSKNNWEQDRRVSEESVAGFAAYALEKLAMEVRKGRR